MNNMLTFICIHTQCEQIVNKLRKTSKDLLVASRTMSKNKAKTKAENRAKRLLIAIVSAFIAIALGATCALWFGNSAKPVSVNGATTDVSVSANRGALTGNQSGWNSSGVPLIAEGDMMEYTYNGGRRSITLPKGTYKLRCGARKAAAVIKTACLARASASADIRRRSLLSKRLQPFI